MSTGAGAFYRQGTWLLAALSVLAVAAAVGAYLGLTAKPGPAARVTRAVVTGYKTSVASDLSSDGRTAGPISVVLHGARGEPLPDDPRAQAA